MEYRLLGATGLKVSEIGFGAWGIGGNNNGAMAYGSTDDRESKRALRRAFELGVTFYDTADFYGFGHSEKLIGEALADVRSQAVIASKVGLLDANGNHDFSAEHIRRSIEGSLRRLRTDYIDLYQLHSPPINVLGYNDEWFSVLHSLKTGGMVRALGISVRTPDDALVAIKKFSFNCIQVNFNLVDQRALEIGLFSECEKANVGLIVRTPLCFGFLTGGYSPDTQFDVSDHRMRWSAAQRKRWSEAHELFEKSGVALGDQTPAHFALRFCLSYSVVSTVIPGMLNVEQVEENISASGLKALSDFQLRKIETIYQQNEFFLR